jgi:hypothetical protein
MMKVASITRRRTIAKLMGAALEEEIDFLGAIMELTR